jgi:hypothetical protein
MKIPFERKVRLMLAIEKSVQEKRQENPNSSFWNLRRDIEDELDELSKGLI